MKPRQIFTLSDEELIEGIRTGGRQGHFEVLYKRYYPKVLDRCYSFTKNRAAAEELAEDVFSKIFEKLPSFRHQSKFSSWLYSITYNHCIDYLRSRKKLHYPNWNRENEMPDIADETDDVPEGITYDKLMVILEQVHPEEKALLLMKYEDGLPMRQIAASLRISEDAAKMRMKRARTRVLYLYRLKYPCE